MGRTKQAGDSNVSMGAAVEEGKEKAPRKPRKASSMRVVHVIMGEAGAVSLEVMAEVSTVKAGRDWIDANVTITGTLEKYAVISVRGVCEVGKIETAVNRKAAL